MALRYAGRRQHRFARHFALENHWPIMPMNLIEHPDSKVLATAAAADMQAALEQALTARHRAGMALAGGSTPLPAYHLLAGCPLDFGAISALPGDERWVALDHAHRNEAALKACFAGTRLNWLPLAPPRPGRQPDLNQARRSLAALGQPLDLAVLGMGVDGHFASLFPNAAALEQGLAVDSAESLLVVNPQPLPPDAPHARISLTLACLLGARHIVLLACGQAKRAVLEQASAADADHKRLPVAALLAAAGRRLAIHWSP